MKKMFIKFKNNRNISSNMTTFTAVIHKEENMYVAKCPEIGTTSQGKTIEQAIENLREATALYLEEFPKPKAGKIIFTTFEVGEIVKA
jgi:predicted RNase H-like HicB family nuclease